MSTNTSTTRRDFLKGSAAATGALVIGFTLPMTSRFGQAAAAASGAAAGFAPNAFLRIAPNGEVTVICGLSEMGQGVHMGIASLVAEELDADWKSVKLEQAPVDKAYINPLFGMQATGGSTAIRGHYEPMRKAGAAAREMLVAAAAAQWGVDAATCRTQDGRVMGPDGKSAGYGELVAAAAKLPVPQNPTLKDAKDFRIIGKGLTRIDTPAKVNGSADFGIDVKLPGLLTAVMVHAPVPGAKIVCSRRRGCESDSGREAGRADSARRRRAGRRLLDCAEGPRRTGREVGRRPARFVVVRRDLETPDRRDDEARCRGAQRGRRQRRRREDDRGRLRSSLPRARLHGADELHGLGARRRGRSLGADAGARARTRASSRS